MTWVHTNVMTTTSTTAAPTKREITATLAAAGVNTKASPTVITSGVKFFTVRIEDAAQYELALAAYPTARQRRYDNHPGGYLHIARKA